MGVSIGYQITVGKTHDITPGARSHMYQIMLDKGLIGLLDDTDLDLLEEAAKDDWVGEKFQILIDVIKKRGSVLTVCNF